MQLQEQLYEGLPSNGAHSDDKVRRRPFGQNLRNRLNTIVSMYIPSQASVERKNDESTCEHAELLSATDAKVDLAPKMFDELYSIQLLYSGEDLVRSIVEGIGTPMSTSTGTTRKITSIAADDHTLYACLEELPYVFLLKAHLESQVRELDGTLRRKELSPIKGYIQLHVPGIGDLVPQELSVYSPTPESTVMYIVGWVRIIVDPKNYTTEKRWLLAKFSLAGQHLARTPVYSYQRYSGVAIDTHDGSLLLAFPQLKEQSTNSHDCTTAQLCKLTQGFERRIFSVTMGNNVATYRPDFVSQESAGRFCWASVQRTPRSDGTQATNEQVTSTSRRLFSFPGRQLEGGEKKQSAREWLQVMSWDFADLTPGRIVAFDADRLLVVDANTGSLSYVTWQQGHDRPTLHRITRPHSKPISLICSNYKVAHGEQEIVPNIAYFVSGSSIYSFSFREDYIAE